MDFQDVSHGTLNLSKMVAGDVHLRCHQDRKFGKFLLQLLVLSDFDGSGRKTCKKRGQKKGQVVISLNEQPALSGIVKGATARGASSREIASLHQVRDHEVQGSK